MASEHSAYVSKITNLNEDVLRSLEFINWREHIKSDSTIFIKPNFTFPYYKEGITTSPKLLKILIGIIKDKADNVIVGESDGGNHSFSADRAFKGHGMYDICKETGAELVNLSKVTSKYVEEEILGKKVKVLLPKLLLEEVDCFISVPVLKVHVMTGVTLSMKNLWGCYPDTMRCLHHKHLSRKLALITKQLNPKLVLIDGIYSLDNHGPMYGDAKKTDLIMSSNNPVVADSLGAAIMGIPLAKAQHILVAKKYGLGTTNLGEMNINDDWEKFKLEFTINKTLLDRFSLLPFNSEILAKIIMDSPFKSLIYNTAKFMRTNNEDELSNELKRVK